MRQRSQQDPLRGPRHHGQKFELHPKCNERISSLGNLKLPSGYSPENFPQGDKTGIQGTREETVGVNQAGGPDQVTTVGMGDREGWSLGLPRVQFASYGPISFLPLFCNKCPFGQLAINLKTL